MTTIDYIEQEREFFTNGQRRSVDERRRILKALLTMLRNNRQTLVAALYDDLHKSEFEALESEFMPLLDSIKNLYRKLPKYAAARKVRAGLINFPAQARIMPEPYGVTLVISTWNYPLLLALEPVAGALAAGNSVVLKLTPQSQATSRAIGWMLEQTFGGRYVRVDYELTLDEVLKQKFDYIFFTGGENTGRMVAAAAAAHLTPVTLEMGGKSPCIVDTTADLDLAARRIAWGKFLNAGQTCVAPDYILVHRAIKTDFLTALRSEIVRLFGENAKANLDYPKIINPAHYQRLCDLMSEGKLVIGGDHDPDKLFIAPTVIDNVQKTDKIMQSEIFGPVLPVLEYGSLEEAIAMINERPKPLALYYFGEVSDNCFQVLNSSSSGGVTVNDCIMHLMSPQLPFGGVGASGMGAYHGQKDFATFTHYKPVLYRGTWFDAPLRYPPFTKAKMRVLKFLCK